MKKLLSVLLVAMLSLALVACNSKPSSDEPSPSKQTESGKPKIAYIVGHLGDKSFSDSGEVGMNALRKEGYEVKTIETSSKQDKFTDYIEDAIDNGANYVYASSTYYDNIRKIAEDHAEVKFVVFDDNKKPEELADNMTVICYAQNEGSYLVGMLAAAMSKTGSVAVNVGMDNPVINDFVTGYVQGILDWNAAHGTNVKVVKAAVGSWSDPAKMKTLCLKQATENNVDVFFQVAGGSGDGLFEAAKETGTWAIGVDSDQYAQYINSENPEKADVILTSMLKEVGNSLVAMTKKIEAGEDVWKKTIKLSTSDNSVGYVENEFYKEKVPADVQAALTEAKEKIKNGEIKVKSYFDFANEAEFEAYLETAQK